MPEFALLAIDCICGERHLEDTYSHALDFSIVDLHNQPATAIEAIRRRLDESWEYVDYNLHDMAFEKHLKQILRTKNN